MIDYGYVCFAYTKNKWYDWCIAKVTKSKWSHSFLTCPPILGKEMAMEACDNGVDVTLFDSSYRNNINESYAIYKMKISKVCKDKSIKNRMKELERSYGYLEYPWLMWRYLNSLFGRDIKSQNNWCQNGTVICSQLLREYISDCGFSYLFEGYGKGSVTPEDIYQIVLKNPKIFKLIESKK
jgi:hypothetical protein